MAAMADSSDAIFVTKGSSPWARGDWLCQSHVIAVCAAAGDDAALSWQTSLADARAHTRAATLQRQAEEAAAAQERRRAKARRGRGWFRPRSRDGGA